MGTIITLLIDIALGALAYRLACENRARITTLEKRLNAVISLLKKGGILDVDHH